ncbi:hypothetical protein EXIGLDRAFT_412160 [Exidia glandulosa HHB12029]|uniref:Uncharacterized protein n=1 Tax=Exidia glandulosa HHB12029 TaxID=1314781 RepID=A0A165BFK5_EXIGL|nr:hypothetical protein EXIGLDRAFT_412160 [Exidia glandulosa HHB12029]
MLYSHKAYSSLQGGSKHVFKTSRHGPALPSPLFSLSSHSIRTSIQRRGNTRGLARAVLCHTRLLTHGFDAAVFLAWPSLAHKSRFLLSKHSLTHGAASQRLWLIGSTPSTSDQTAISGSGFTSSTRPLWEEVLFARQQICRIFVGRSPLR